MHTIFAYLSLFITVLIVNTSIAQNSETDQNPYEKGMSKALELWNQEKKSEALNVFERIANADPDKWLPPYYIAQINIIESFTEKDATKLKAKLDKAQDYINDATAISKENPELLVLQAQLFTSWIVFDGQRYGMTYSGKATELYQKALAIAPNNPRVILGNAEWNIGAAKFFGSPVDKYCKDIVNAIALFPSFKPEEKFYPTYGEERAKQVLKQNCN